MKLETGGYYIDLSTYGLHTLKIRLTHIHLMSSQEILREDMDDRFATLASFGIQNLKQLQTRLKDKKAVAAFAEQSGLPEEYLTVLRRWVNGYQPKPVNLSEFDPVAEEVVQKLSQMGIRNTLQLFPRVRTPDLRMSFAKETGISESEILILTKLTDLVRMKWVGPKFAHLLLASGFDTVEKVASADGIALYNHLKKVGEETGIYKGGFSEDDINLWVQHVVCDVPISISY